jgi:hypothetical protein
LLKIKSSDVALLKVGPHIELRDESSYSRNALSNCRNKETFALKRFLDLANKCDAIGIDVEYPAIFLAGQWQRQESNAWRHYAWG